ncbi:hypothetical protein DMENIID0001_060140 [Sergentomyia squamirostris]
MKVIVVVVFLLIPIALAAKGDYHKQHREGKVLYTSKYMKTWNEAVVACKTEGWTLIAANGISAQSLRQAACGSSSFRSGDGDTPGAWIQGSGDACTIIVCSNSNLKSYNCNHKKIYVCRQ